MYHLVESNKEEVNKLKCRLHELIQTLDQPLSLRINWRDIEIIGQSIPQNPLRCYRLLLLEFCALVFGEQLFAPTIIAPYDCSS